MSYKVRNKANGKRLEWPAFADCQEYQAWHICTIYAMQDEIFMSDFMCNYTYVSPWRKSASYHNHGENSDNGRYVTGLSDCAYEVEAAFERSLNSLRQAIQAKAF